MLKEKIFQELLWVMNLEQVQMSEFEQVAAWVQQNTQVFQPLKMKS